MNYFLRALEMLSCTMVVSAFQHYLSDSNSLGRREVKGEKGEGFRCFLSVFGCVSYGYHWLGIICILGLLGGLFLQDSVVVQLSH